MNKFLKVFSLVLALSMVLVFAACGGNGGNESEKTTGTTGTAISIPADFKIGIILLHDENSTYDKNFIVAA